MASQQSRQLWHNDDDTASLANALDKNESIQQEASRVAVELTVINTVLQQEIPAHAQSGDVAQALRKTNEIEDRIQKSADELAEVNLALEHEIDEREELERELANAKAQLARVGAKTAVR
jgi:phosphoglycerate-specific signal transduction histidine kinase